MKNFKTINEGMKFFEDFIYSKATKVSESYYNKLDKLWELNGCYKNKNEIIWDMFWDWEEVISEIYWDLHIIKIGCGFDTEWDRLNYINSMLSKYEWYIKN